MRYNGCVLFWDDSIAITLAGTPFKGHTAIQVFWFVSLPSAWSESLKGRGITYTAKTRWCHCGHKKLGRRTIQHIKSILRMGGFKFFCSFHPDLWGTGIQFGVYFFGSVKKNHQLDTVPSKLHTELELLGVVQRPMKTRILAVREDLRERSENRPANGTHQD